MAAMSTFPRSIIRMGRERISAPPMRFAANPRRTFGSVRSCGELVALGGGKRWTHLRYNGGNRSRAGQRMLPAAGP